MPAFFCPLHTSFVEMSCPPRADRCGIPRFGGSKMAWNKILKGRNGIIIAAAVVAAGLFGLVIWMLVSGGPRSERQKELDRETERRREVREEMERLGIPGETSVSSMERKVFSTKAKPSREDVESFYRYPRNSRPLDKTMQDLIRPLEFRSALMPAFRTGNPMDTGKPDFAYQISIQKTIISGGESVVATLEAYDVKDRVPVKVQVSSARILSDDRTGHVEVGDAAWSDDGKGFDKTADDKVVTLSWKPPYSGRLYWGNMEMAVKFKIADHAEAVYKLSFESVPEPPAIITGKFRETVKDGSLIIGVEMDVKKAGHYIIEANLFHKSSGEPTHWVVFNDDIEQPGKQFVELTFFGKIFHDKNLDGRFVMRNLRGFRDNIDYSSKKLYSDEELERINAKTRERNEPERWMLIPFMGDHVTESYDMHQFSDREYDGEDKRRRLEALIEQKAD